MQSEEVSFHSVHSVWKANYQGFSDDVRSVSSFLNSQLQLLGDGFPCTVQVKSEVTNH